MRRIKQLVNALSVTVARPIFNVRRQQLGRSQRRQALLDMLFDLARTAQSEEVQLAAIVAWLNRFEGKPVAMTARGMVGDPSALNDADLDHELRLHAAHIQEKEKKE